MRPRGRGPIGVLLAGGDGRRLGGDKARLELAGRPLARWALEALAEAVDTVVVACRLDTELPPLPGVAEAWVEPDGPRGPVAGIVSALREARGRAVLVLAISHPLVLPGTLRTLARAPARDRPAVAPLAGGRPVPLVARFEPAAHDLLAALPAATDPRRAMRALGPATVRFDDAEQFLRIDGPEDVLRAGAALDARRRARVHA